MVVCFVLELASCCVSQADLKPLGSSDSSALAFQLARTMGEPSGMPGLNFVGIFVLFCLLC